jgi:putative restriction endonuclease
MNYWWVNQNQTFKAEVGGGFLWSPKTRADGARNQFYENMREVEPGDVIFSFCDTRIKAVGVASQRAVAAPKPDFGSAGGAWSDEGWLVTAEFSIFENSIRPKDHIDLLRPHLPVKYSPLQATGDGLQSVYLASVPLAMAEVMIDLIGSAYQSALDKLMTRIDPDVEAPATVLERALIERTDIGPTQKQQLINARRGQGLFRANVRLHEKSCRLTQISDPEHLRASHIKPWKDSSDTEKIDGSNGLFLAPHIDHLFDRGFISFADSGHLLISPALTSTIANSWGVVDGRNVGSFTDKQKSYLGYHRQNVFKAAKND